LNSAACGIDLLVLWNLLVCHIFPLNTVARLRQYCGESYKREYSIFFGELSMIARFAFLTALSLCCAGFALAANAATVSRESGEVLVNRGGGFVALNGPAELGSGTQVMVRPGGTALIAYSGDCVLRVGSGRVWTVQSNPPCQPGKQIDMTGRMNQQAGDGLLGLDTTHVIIGTLAIGGGVAAAILLGNGDDDSHGPASP